jgi:2-polyprenyl-6-methoxyphenol hydroxylase-like FAD-dependent oxidoreductase/predicted DsbA family dithiol-disulfide isomerase
MKTVIIGGGIAGLAMGIYLHNHGMKVVVCERGLEQSHKGNAFLMHAEGISILSELSKNGSSSGIPGKFINHFSLCNENNDEITYQKLDPWQCMKRTDVVSFLYDQFPEEKLMFNREFSHFIYKDEQAVAAVFKNGEQEYGDIFIGADGGISKVRNEIFGQTEFTKTEVKEVLGLLNCPALSKKLGTRFTKFQHESKSISFGMIPSSENEVVWFMQYDPRIMDIHETSPRAMEMFCQKMLKDFPEPVQELLSLEDFTGTYIWHTKDFDLLPSFHKKNIVLIGDSAHLALPFTSAGTTNALVDAHTLFTLLKEGIAPEKAFEKFYALRSQIVAAQIKMGRDLKKDFLHPEKRNKDGAVIPLISKQDRAIKRRAKQKEIQIVYFTDPICSTCWVIQPQLRKLSLEYENHLQIDFKMGGLLPSWENFNRFGITKPSDVAAHWEEVCSQHEMPINKNIWLEDPLPSSYPPSIAFKAAQIQDTGKAVLFLRRIREMVFLEKKNIIKKEHLFTAAFDVGLDAARLLRDLEGKAQGLFREDLILSHTLDVKELPTLFFSNHQGKQLSLQGYQSYESFEKILLELHPSIKKQAYATDPKSLFDRFQTMTTKEFSFFRNETEMESQYILHNLLMENKITQFESTAGNMWINNFSNQMMAVLSA